MKVIISGGGTGGHVFPAIAVAQALQANGRTDDILFVGAEGKMEMDRVPKAGFRIVGLPVSGFHRSRKWRNLSFPWRLIRSMVKAMGIIRKFRPDVVVGFGGYASGPMAQAAIWRKIPVVLQEQNSYAGITNRLLARKAEKICVAYEGMEKFFEKGKIIFTGNPVRKDIMGLDNIKEESHEYFGLVQNKKTILIFGGSLGARALNEAVRHNLPRLRERTDLQFIWQAGSLYFEEYNSLPEAAWPNVCLLPFIERMDLAYAAADLVVCRAGALTISELCLAARPAILVPSPIVAEDHQTKNALKLSEKGAAWMLPDHQVKEKLGTMITEILESPGQMKEAGTKLAAMAKPGAADQIAELVWQAGSKKNK